MPIIEIKRIGPSRRLSSGELMLSNGGAGEEVVIIKMT